MVQKGRAWIELNMSHLIHNVTQLQNILPETSTLMPVLKANAYGHDAVATSQVLQNMGIQNFCVASVAEGIELRNAGITGQILILGYTHPMLFPELVHYGLSQTIIDFAYALELNNYGKPLLVHVGVDTGMHRIGIPYDEPEQIVKLWELTNLTITGVFSHLCMADGTSEREQSFSNTQQQRFQAVIDALHQRGHCHFTVHMQSSYGLLNYPDWPFDYARVGIALFGALNHSGDTIAAVNLKPVLSLKARITCIRTVTHGEGVGYGLQFTANGDRQIATVSIGYADGIPRQLSNRGQALVHGRKVPIVGLICMDQLMLDVTGIEDICAGDEALFIGSDGNEEITAGEIAASTGTITNEILSGIGPRVERVVIP